MSIFDTIVVIYLTGVVVIALWVRTQRWGDPLKNALSNADYPDTAGVRYGLLALVALIWPILPILEVIMKSGREKS